MNKLFKILLILVAVAVASCNPMKDINHQLNQQAPPPSATFNYTLSGSDYSTISSAALANATNATDSATAKSVSSDQALPDGYAAKYVPPILGSMYPALGAGSVAHVTYNLNGGPLAATVMYEAANQYTLGNADYTSMGGNVANYGTFYPGELPANYIPDFLKTKFANAADSTLEFVTYNYSDQTPTTPPPVFDAEFASDNTLENFTAVSVYGSQNWTNSSYGAKMSGYSGGDQNDTTFLVSPQIDLSNYSHPCYQVNQTINYLGGQWNQVQILASSDYSGNVSTATWTNVTPKTLPTGNDWTAVTSEKVDLSAFHGKKIYLAFKYVSTTSNAATWEVAWLKVYSSPASTALGTQSVFYRLLNGTWKPESGIYALSSDDYSAMGAPGNYDDFSSSENPDNYIPQFLAQKYPYAQQGDQMFIAYEYYSGGDQLRVDQYTFTNSAWTKYDPIATETSQFLFSSAINAWAFDPTVSFTMSASDYQLIIDYVSSDPNLKQYVDSYGTDEYYYGASSYYSDFNAQISKRTDPAFSGLNQQQAEALITQRIQDGVIVMLQQKFPNAVTQVSGINVFYIVTYWVYENDGSNAEFTSTFQCTKSAPDPSFTWIKTVQDQ